VLPYCYKLTKTKQNKKTKNRIDPNKISAGS